MLKKIIFFLLLTSHLVAQDTWSLERCIEYAQKNNTTIKQSQLQVTSAALGIKQAKASQLPNIGFSTNLGGNFGRSINPSTNQFENDAVGFNSASINLNQAIYDGGRINNSIKQSKIDEEAAQADLAQTIQNISLSVAQAYLQVLLSEEQLAASKKRFEQSKQQLEQIKKLAKAGSRPVNDTLEFDAQVARNIQSLVAAQNSVDIGYLTLKQLLELDPELPFKIERPLINAPSITDIETLTLRAVYNQAYSRQPQIQAGELRLRSAELGADIAKSDRRPTIGLFANVSSNYSTVLENIPTTKRNAVRDLTILVPNANPTYINGNRVTIETEFTTYSPSQFVHNNYFRQMYRNFGQALGMSIQIPIYDRGLTKIAVERARLATINQQLQNQRTQNQLKSDIQSALANAKAAKKQYEAADKAYNAAKNVYENTDKKYKVGSANNFEVVAARTNMDTAERDLIVAKYDYIFKLKIIDFYQGRKIMLN
jgi:outer membrane protein